MKILKNERGQSATEYMLVIAIVVLGLVAAASKLLPKFNHAVEGMGDTIASDYIANHPRAECPNGGTPPNCS